MSYIRTTPLKNSTIMLLYADRSRIDLAPAYQRMGGVWTREKKQLLIDSVLNDYDIPKIYFHQHTRLHSQPTPYQFAVIDGRQRLEAIWSFIDGKFNLADDFELLERPELNLAGLSYDDLSKKHPRIKIQFDSFTLPVVVVETDEEDLIEDMFSRLNEAVPLNAAEKRNAIGGDLVEGIRRISEHPLFMHCVTFSNRRYQHREVAARFLLMEHSMTSGKGRLTDTKKVYLDALARSHRAGKATEVQKLVQCVTATLDSMIETFMTGDSLLRSQGMMNVYYLLFRLANITGQLNKITRESLLEFRELRRENRELAASNYEDAKFELLEYDRLNQQGTNDATNIRERVNILSSYLDISSS